MAAAPESLQGDDVGEGAARLAALRRLGLLDPQPEDGFDWVTRVAARAVGAPTAMISLVTADRQLIKSHVGLREPWATRREVPLEVSFCRRVVEADAPLVVPDARADPDLADAAAATGVVAYLGVPLHAPDGVAVGTLCAVEGEPRVWDAGDLDVLRDLADGVERALVARQARREAHRAVEGDASEGSRRLAVEERYHAVVEAMSEGVLVMRADGVAVSMNRSAARILGVRADEVVGTSLHVDRWAVVREDGSPWPVAGLPAQRVLATGEAQRGAVMGWRRPGGSILWIVLDAAPVRLADGAPGVVVTFSDITERKALEDARRDLADRQAALARVAEVVAGGAAPTEVFELVSREVARLFGAGAAGVVRFEDDGAMTMVGGVSTPELPPLPLHARLAAAAQPTRLAAVRATGEPDRSLPGTRGLVLPGYGERVAAAIRLGDAVWGALVAAAPPGRDLPDGLELRLRRFAELVGVAIGEAEAREQLRVRAAQQEALRLLSERVLALPLDDALDEVALVVAAALDADAAAIVEGAAGGGGVLFAASCDPPSAAPGVALGVRAIAAGAPVLGDAAGSGAAVPILHEGAPWGAIAATSARAGRIGERDLVFLRSVANTASAVVARDLAQRAMRHQAFHDALTGIPNRSLLHDRLAHALDRGRRDGARVAVIFCDLDDFKDLNDRRGHEYGDELLVAVAARLRRGSRPGDTLARIGGDEFVVLCERVDDEAEALRIGLRLAAAVAATPFAVGDEQVPVTTSVGVTVCGPDDTVSTALRDADQAMYRAKALGRGRVELFDAAMRRRIDDRRRTQEALAAGVERGEIVVRYQPVVSLASGRVVAVEALARWARPGADPDELAMPDWFVPIAEESGLIVRLGAEVIGLACADAVRFDAAAPSSAPLLVTANLSPRQLADPAIVDTVRGALAAHGLAPGRFGLEITEAVLLDDDPQHVGRLDALRELGVRIVLDDFGSGLASLAAIRRLRLDRLKVDHRFVAGLPGEDASEAIVAAVARLGVALGMPIIAEGIERPDQLRLLRSLGCSEGQGFLLARPATADEIVARLRADAAAGV